MKILASVRVKKNDWNSVKTQLKTQGFQTAGIFDSEVNHGCDEDEFVVEVVLDDSSYRELLNIGAILPGSVSILRS